MLPGTEAIVRTILDLCVAMDTFSHRTYESMATSCQDPDLAAVFSRMAESAELGGVTVSTKVIMHGHG